jgi:hypothetical protein
LLLELTDAFPLSCRTTYEHKLAERERENAAEVQRRLRNRPVANNVRGDDWCARVSAVDELTSADDEEHGNQTTERERAQSDHGDRAFNETTIASALFRAVASAQQIALSPMITLATMSSPQDASANGGQALEIGVLETSSC